MVLAQMQQRRGSAAQWALANPVLAAGEEGVEVDTLKFKIGNGTDVWTALPYQQSDDSFIASLVTNPSSLTNDAIEALIAAAPPPASSLPWFHPKDYGAVGDGVADDTAALQAAATAARLGAGTVYIGGKSNTTYLITDRVDFYGPTGLFGDQVIGQLSDVVGSTIVFGHANAQIRLAGRESPSNTSSRGGSFHDFNINANGFEHVDGAFHLDLGVERDFYNISITDAAGDGMVLDTTQNSTFRNIAITNCGHIAAGKGAGLVLDNGCGGNAFFRCEISSNYIDIDSRDSLPGAHNGYPYGPGRNNFYHCLLEDYAASGTYGYARVRATHGQSLRFVSTAFSTNGGPQSSGYLMHITTAGLIQTEIALGGGCTFSGNDSTHAVFVGANARVVVDGAIGMGDCLSAFTTDAATSLGWINGRIDVSGVPVIQRELPGGNFDGWRYEDEFGRLMLTDPTISTDPPLSLQRIGDAQRVFFMDNTGTLNFGAGAIALYATLGLDIANDNMAITGGLMQQGRRGHVRATQFAASGAVTLDTKSRSVHHLSTTGNITSMAFSNPVNNAELTVLISKGSAAHTIAWPSDVRFSQNRVPVVSVLLTTVVQFRYESTGSTWIEIGRVEEVGTTASTRQGRDAYVALGSIAAMPDLSTYQALGQTFHATLTGNITITPSLLPTAPTGSGRISFYLIQDGTGSRTLTLNSAIKTAGGVDPTLSTAAGAIDVLDFLNVNGTWVCTVRALNIS